MNTPEQLTEEERRKVLRIIDAHAADRAALVARVAELERLHEQALNERDAAHLEMESEVERLREALAAAEGIIGQLQAGAMKLELERATVAEARVRELEAEVAALDAAHRRMLDERNEWQDTAASYLDEGRTRWEAAERQLAAANALLGRIPDCLLTDCPVHADLSAYKRAHLSAQPAALAEHDQDEPTCRAATHGRRNSTCICEDARDE